MSSSSGNPVSDNKGIALLIAVLALFLAFSEAGGKQSEGASISANIEASNLWAFFKAKTIRRATLITSAEALEATGASAADPEARERVRKLVEKWRADAQRLETEPETREGRRELMARAKAAEQTRDLEKAKNGWFEIASGSLQIAIVLASAAIITGVGLLAWAAGGLGLIGLGLMGLALLAPQALNLF
jgi:hypothetical protein